MRVIRKNPYKNAKFNQPLKADLHFHTTESDGNNTVAQMVNAYADLGFKVLSITDHDFIPPSTPTWPWIDYGIAPESVDMIAIKGNECSWYVEPYNELNQHHICSYFNDYGGYEGSNEHETMQGIGALGGLAIWAHPWSPPYHPEKFQNPESYIEYYLEYPHLLGQEFSTVVLDSNILDYVLRKIASLGRNIFITATSDAHSISDIGKKYVFFLCEKDESSIRVALENGEFIAVIQNESLSVPPTIQNINVDNDNAIITITASNYSDIRWISNGEEIGIGDSFNFSNLDPQYCYVRAIITGTNATVFTNPILLWQSRWIDGTFVNASF